VSTQVTLDSFDLRRDLRQLNHSVAVGQSHKCIAQNHRDAGCVGADDIGIGFPLHFSDGKDFEADEGQGVVHSHSGNQNSRSRVVVDCETAVDSAGIAHNDVLCVNVDTVVETSVSYLNALVHTRIQRDRIGPVCDEDFGGRGL